MMRRQTMNTLALLCFLIFQSCMTKPTSVVEVDDQESELLSIMMQKEDFEGRTNWRSELIRQQSQRPSQQNRWLAEIASRGLSGEYNQKYYIVIDNRLYRFTDQIDRFEPSTFTKGEDEISIDISFPPLGNNRQAHCYSNPITVRCEVIVQYDYVLSYIWVNGPNTLSSNDLLKLIVPVMLKIDERVSQ